MLKGIYGVLIGMLIILLVMFGSLFVKQNNQTQQQEAVVDPKYHIQVIVQSSDENFWTMFREGAKVAEEEKGVYVEFVPLSTLTVDSLREAVEMGVNAGVDGIALQAADSQQSQIIIDNAKEQGVRIITYEDSNYNISDTPMVRTNSYSLGFSVGDMAVEATGGNATVALVINSSANDGEEEYTNNIIQGIKSAFSPYGKIDLPYPNIHPINTDMFEAEKVTSDILESEQIPELIICLDEKVTPGIAQILVDRNLVGDIKVVGYGITEQTLEYIQHGVIYGTICPVSYEIGYKTVTSMVQLLEGETVSEAIDTSLFTIDKDNVKQYIETAQTE